MKRNVCRLFVVISVMAAGMVMSVPSTALSAESARETPIVKVVKENAPAVVNISTERVVLLRESPYWGPYGSQFDQLFDNFFGMQQRTRALKLKSVGSGVVVEDDGLIVTNAHVVHMATNIIVIFPDGEKREGRIVYENLKDDLALIRVDAPASAEAVNLAEDDDIFIGETVVAIGNPLGLENSVSSGIISGIDRKAFSQRGLVSNELIQTDAPINPGNSGGALLNLDGELVGINVAMVQNSQSIGFAIPVKRVKKTIASHKKNKELAVKDHRQPPAPAQGGVPQAQGPRPGAQWDPFEEMRRIREEMDRLFTHSLNTRRDRGAKGMFNSSIVFNNDFNLKEEKDRYVIEVEVGDIDKDNIDIEINEHSITIKGQTSAGKKQSGPQGAVSSRTFGSFLKTFPLPEDADTEDITTDVKDNRIRVIIPKK
jgi:S1-C subfamily serine protease/HSP20 family molecular chaperone IbpA